MLFWYYNYNFDSVFYLENKFLL